MKLSTVFLATTAVASAEVSSKHGIQRREQQNRGCVSWPPEENNLPLSGSFLNVGDGSAPLCGKMNTLLMDSWSDGWGSAAGSVPVDPSSTSVDCGNYSPSTIVSMVQLSVFNPAFDAIRECFQEDPYILFRSPPKEGAISEIASKDGLAMLVNKYAPCGSSDDCIIPETFRISEDVSECQGFFELLDTNPAFAQRDWLKKPVTGFGGSGVESITDLQADLIDPYSDCENQSGPPIIVQRYVKPYLVDDHACHLRTYFLYKFGSEPIVDEETGATTVADPPQGWRVDGGNVYVCTEPYSEKDDPEMGQFALTCNKPWWVNPRADDQLIMSLGTASQMFDFGGWGNIMGGVTRVFNTLGLLFDEHTQATESWSKPNEAAWAVIAADLIIDSDLRPWLVDVNPCHKNPSFYDPEDLTGNWNPYISIFRIVLSHYKRHFFQDPTISEGDCSGITFSTTVNPAYPVAVIG